jgi:hypothetical protein
MLARRREQIFLVLGLVALNVLLGWYLAGLARDYRSRTRWIYAGVSSAPLSTPAPRPNQAAWPQSFTQIVDRNLFSPQRASQPPQQEEVKVPPLPLLFGTMNLGDGWFALMASGGETSPASKKVLPGEEIGGFKLLSIGASDVVVAWQERQFTVDVSESARRVPRIVEKTVNTNGRPAPTPTTTTAAARTNPVTSVAPSSASGSSERPTGQWAPPGASPDAPIGTIAGGMQKVLIPTPFGGTIQWRPVAPQPGAVTSTQPEKTQP